MNRELLSVPRENTLMSKIFQVICVMFLYDPNLTISTLTEKGYANEIIASLLSEGNRFFSTEFEKKRQLFCYASLLSLPRNMLPQDSHLPSIMKQSLELCDYIVTQQSRKVKKRALESTSNSSTQNTDYDEADDNDPDWDEEDSDEEGNVFY